MQTSMDVSDIEGTMGLAATMSLFEQQIGKTKAFCFWMGRWRKELCHDLFCIKHDNYAPEACNHAALRGNSAKRTWRNLAMRSMSLIRTFCRRYVAGPLWWSLGLKSKRKNPLQKCLFKSETEGRPMMALVISFGCLIKLLYATGCLASGAHIQALTLKPLCLAMHLKSGTLKPLCLAIHLTSGTLKPLCLAMHLKSGTLQPLCLVTHEPLCLGLSFALCMLQDTGHSCHRTPWKPGARGPSALSMPQPQASLEGATLCF